MSRILTTIALISLSLVLLVDCGLRETEIQGSVFIVTKGADNYKLGLVKVTAISEYDVISFLNNKKSLIGTETTKLKSDIEAAKIAVGAFQKDYDEAKKSYDILNSQKGDIKGRESSLSSEYNPYSYISPYSEYDTPEMVAERNKNIQVGKQLDAVRKQLEAFEIKVSKASLAVLDAEKPLNSAKAKLGEMVDKIVSYLTPAYLLDGLPEGKIKSVTDAEGKFSMKLPAGKYALFATAQRRVFSTTEDYYWLIWIDTTNPEIRQVTLSNQNLMGEDSEDAVFKIKELVPLFEQFAPGAPKLNVGV